MWHYLPPPHLRKGSLYYKTNAVFCSLYICEKPASLAYQEKKQLQEKLIIALRNKNKEYSQQKAWVNANMHLV